MPHRCRNYSEYFCLFRGKGRDRIDQRALEPIRASQMLKANTISLHTNTRTHPHKHAHTRTCTHSNPSTVTHTLASHKRVVYATEQAHTDLPVTQPCVESGGFNKRHSMKQYDFYIYLRTIASIQYLHSNLSKLYKVKKDSVFFIPFSNDYI